MQAARLQAGYGLVKMGPAAVKALVALVATESDSLCYICAQILGRIGDPRALPVLRELLGDPRTMSELIAILQEDSRPDLRAAAAESLGNLSESGTLSSLIRALKDSVAVVRKQGMAALHRLWTGEAVFAVTEALRDPDETVRYVAAQSLGQRRVVAAAGLLRAALRDTSVYGSGLKRRAVSSCWRTSTRSRI